MLRYARIHLDIAASADVFADFIFSASILKFLPNSPHRHISEVFLPATGERNVDFDKTGDSLDPIEIQNQNESKTNSLSCPGLDTFPSRVSGTFFGTRMTMS